MTEQNNIRTESRFYEEPRIEVVEVEVEKGFAASSPMDMDTIDWTL